MISSMRFFSLVLVCWTGGALFSRFFLDSIRAHRVEIDNLQDCFNQVLILSTGGLLLSLGLAGFLEPGIANHWLVLIGIGSILAGIMAEHFSEICIPSELKPELRQPHHGQQPVTVKHSLLRRR